MDYWIHVNITATAAVLTLNQFLTLNEKNICFKFFIQTVSSAVNKLMYLFDCK